MTVVGCVVIVWLADYPGGDIRGIGAMAAWVPSPIMVPALLVALLASAFTLHRWHARAATWPWLVMVGGAIIGITGLRAILGLH